MQNLFPLTKSILIIYLNWYILSSTFSLIRMWSYIQASKKILEIHLSPGILFFLLSHLLAPPRRCSNIQVVQGSSPVPSIQHIGLSVPNYSNLFNNDLAIPEMVRMVRK